MPNLLQSFARANLNRRARHALLAASLLAAFALPVTANAAETNIKFRNQDIWVEGVSEADGTIKWIGDKTAGDAELLLIYKGSSGSFRTSANVEARVLAIGGGGAGGYGTTGSNKPGGGGGGGEVIEIEMGSQILRAFSIFMGVPQKFWYNRNGRKGI